MKRKHSQSKTNRQPLLIGLAIAVLVLGGVLVYGLNTQSKTQPYPFKTWQLNDKIKDQKLEFTTHSVSDDSVGMPGFWAPSKDETFIVVSMSFTNRTGKVYHLSPVQTMKLRDSNNHEYAVTSAPTIKTGLGGPVRNGETTTGEVGFIVPKAASGLQLIFDPRIVDENIIQVNLNH